MLFKSSEIKDDLLPSDELVSDKITVQSFSQLQKLIRINDKLDDVLKDWDFKTDLHYVTHGHWSLHNLIEYLLPKTGPANIYLATWSISEDATRSLINLADARLIKKIYAILDYRSKNRHEASFHLAKSHFAKMHTTACHAKVTVIECADFIFSINGSPNFTNNPRIESGVISVSKEIGEWHKKWILDVMNKVSVFE